MTIYSAYLPPLSSPAIAEDEFRLVPDAKAPLALILAPFWLAWHRLWLELLAYLVLIAGVILLGVWQPSALISYLSVLPGFYLLLEGNEHVRYMLERKGWRFSGVVEADSRDEAEIRYLMNPKIDLKSATPDTKRGILPLKPVRGSAGLFPE